MASANFDALPPPRGVVDEATVCDGDASFVSGGFLAVGRAAHGLQHPVVDLECGGCNACVASCLALVRWGKRDLNTLRPMSLDKRTARN